MQDGLMYDKITGILKSHKIEYTGVIPFSECVVINERLLSFVPKNVLFFLVPYYTGEFARQNVSHYAVSRDYHLFFKHLFSRIESEFPENNIKGFSDHSPVAEVAAAAKAGLGLIGDNGLLIHEKYGSYVFIGEIFTDTETDETVLYGIKRCSGCGACRLNCPSHDSCLSKLTQKKGLLTEKEQRLVKSSPYVWGCDICQKVCPHNRGIHSTPVDFFRQDRIPFLDLEAITDMDDREFNRRAYSWRKRETILRNIKLTDREHSACD